VSSCTRNHFARAFERGDAAPHVNRSTSTIRSAPPGLRIPLVWASTPDYDLDLRKLVAVPNVAPSGGGVDSAFAQSAMPSLVGLKQRFEIMSTSLVARSMSTPFPTPTSKVPGSRWKLEGWKLRVIAAALVFSRALWVRRFTLGGPTGRPNQLSRGGRTGTVNARLFEPISALRPRSFC
jgi:hypothetical protein